MKVKTVRVFYDLKEDVYREKGTSFEVTQDRFKELTDFVEEVEAKKKPPTKQVKSDGK